MARLLFCKLSASNLSQHLPKQQNNTNMNHFFNKYALFSLGTPFLPEKNPRRARHRLAKWAGAIQSPSLAQWFGPRLGPKILTMFDIFLTFFEVVWDHLGCVWGVGRGRQEQLLSKIFSNILYFYKMYFYFRLSKFRKKSAHPSLNIVAKFSFYPPIEQRFHTSRAVEWSFTARTLCFFLYFAHFFTFFHIFSHFLKLFGIIRDASRGSLEVVRSNFCQKHFRTFYLLKKWLGGSVQEGPRRPPDSLKKY